MSESRTELLSWLNDLLQINYTKVEQVGTGAAHCQVIDSIFRDVPMQKVKFEAKHQYEYVQNFKVLQNAFMAHKIDKIIPVERLIQCKFQDNLEFLQWMKKYWDTYYPGGSYDAQTRRKSKGPVTSGSPGATRRTLGSPASANLKKTSSNPTVDRAGKGLKSNNAARVNSNSSVDASVVDDLQRRLSEMKTTVDGLEKERDFYFGKLRDIEILVQQAADAAAAPDSNGADLPTLLKDVQSILYSTEEGFEVPPEDAAAAHGGMDEEETF